MPKIKTPKSVLIRQWTSGSQCYTVDGETVFCQPCGKQVPCEKKFHLQQHERTALHQANALRNQPSTSRQSFLAESIAQGKKSEFSADLCEALVAANIPWAKIENKTFKNFLQKYCKQKVPSESTLRKEYLRPLYEKTLQEIRREIGEFHIWISVDETTDVTGRVLGHFVVGKLDAEEKTTPFLVCSKELEKTSGETIARFVNSSLKLLYPSGAHDDRVLLLYTDAAAYMLKAGALLKVFYPELLHVTCLAHGIHRVCEELRKSFSSVNELIAVGKAVFLKAPSRVRAFREQLPGVPLPPEPVVTRWGTWLTAVEYYNQHLNGVKAVVSSFAEDESVAVRRAQKVLHDVTLACDLAYLCAHFTFLATTIQKLESSGTTLTENIQLILDAQERFASAPRGPVADRAIEKLKSVLDRNPGFSTLTELSEVLSGGHTAIPDGIKTSNVPKYKYAPLTSVDVERSFSAYKTILTDRRHNFKPENLEIVLVCHCFHSLSHSVASP
ncbi:uncharacterized protein LOC144139806 [Haemaphysalis longicornis]